MVDIDSKWEPLVDVLGQMRFGVADAVADPREGNSPLDSAGYRRVYLWGAVAIATVARVRCQPPRVATVA